MFSRKKALENIVPLQKGGAVKKKGQPVNGPDALTKGVPNKVRRAATNVPTKRAAFGDLTNATKEKIKVDDGKKRIAKTTTKPTAIALKTNKSKGLRKAGSKDSILQPSKGASKDVSTSESSDYVVSSQESVPENQVTHPEIIDADPPDDAIKSEIHEQTEDNIKQEVDSTESSDSEEDLVDFDLETYDDVYHVGRYAQDIFDYYKRRERMFPIPAYMDDGKHEINPGMRAILVDWMVEVQENFELNHETLYLAVKLTDLYLSMVAVKKESLQLVGAAAIFISSKFDERFPPLIEDFTYVCDNAFDQNEFLEMEMEVLRRVGFDLGIPISYRFLRRYSKVARMPMKTLTLARYILELSLMEHTLITERDSKIAAAALLIAMKMDCTGNWEGDVVKSSGYPFSSIKDVVVKLNKMLLTPPVPQLSTIRDKYSHKVFHEVAKIEVLPTDYILANP